MSETTAAQAPRQRKKPARFCRLTHTGGKAVLVIRQPRPRAGDVVDTYAVEVFPSHEGGRGVELTKHDGTRYHVHLDGGASHCECLGWLRWGHRAPCRHVASLLALQRAGRL